MNPFQRLLTVALLITGLVVATAGATPAPPSISSWSPYQGPPGTVVTIAGKNLTTTSAVYFNGAAATNLQVQSDWYVKATVPANATTGKVKIVTQGGAYTASSDFKVTGIVAPPTLSAFSPAQGPVGTQITLSGTGLTGTTGVTVNGKAATQLQVVSDGSVKATVAAGTTSGAIQVTTPAGSATSASAFQVTAAGPAITGFSPTHGPVGSLVTITGSGFTGAGGASFNATPASQVQVVNDGTVTAVVAAGPTTGPITISTPGGNCVSGSAFQVDLPLAGAWIDPPVVDPPAGAMTGHPRLFIRPQDVARLQGWATPSNPVWSSLLYLANNMKQDMDSGKIVDPTGNEYNYAPTVPESYAEMFAFMSLVHPDPATRSDYANRAYALIMPIFNQASLGTLDGQPYRSHNFATGNRASWFGEAFPLTVDWIYDRFSAQDKAKIRTTFLIWIQQCLHATTTGADHPEPYGVVNDPSLTATPHQVMWAANNYYCNHMRHVGMMSMAVDALDDVPSAAGDPPAGTLRRFVGNAIGAWLYQVSANENSYSAGGAMPEGLGYGELTQRAVAFLLLAMHTAGVDNPAVYGAQAADINSPHWTDDVLNSYLHLHSPSQVVQQSWIGPAFLPYQWGDFDHYWDSDYVRVFGALAIHAMNTGDTARYAKLRWAIDNLPPGGVGARNYKITSAVSGSSITMPLFYFMSVDPSFNGAVDPRPSLPTDYFAAGQGVQLSRTTWISDAAWFTFKCSPCGIDHQFADGNAVGFWRAGEWLTKPCSGYGINIGASDSQNTLSIDNTAPTSDSLWQAVMAHGSQFYYDPAGAPTVTASVGPGYTFAQGDATNLYNCPLAGASDVAHASRSVVWLKPDALVIYDRATSKSAGRYKRFCLNTSALAAVSGASATVTTASGQRLFVDAVFPANPTLSSGTMPNIGNEKAAMEPMQYRFTIEDPAQPLDARYLTVLQGAGAGTGKQTVTGFSSQSGTPCQGAVIGSCAVLFKRDLAAPFTGVTFTAPTAVTAYTITGLVPGSGYTVSLQGGNAGTQVTVIPGGSAIADAGGVLTF